MNAEAIDAVFRRLDPTIWIVTAADGPRRGGLVATFVSCASIVPDLPRVLAGIARQHHTWGLIESSGAFALQLLDPSQPDLAWRFGLTSGRDADKLDGLPQRIGPGGSPILDAAPAWLACRVEARMETGDRTVYLAEVLDGELRRDVPPLTLRGLLDATPEPERARLAANMARDRAVDAAAIRAWRAGGP